MEFPRLPVGKAHDLGTIGPVSFGLSVGELPHDGPVHLVNLERLQIAEKISGGVSVSGFQISVGIANEYGPVSVFFFLRTVLIVCNDGSGRVPDCASVSGARRRGLDERSRRHRGLGRIRVGR